MGKRGLTLLFIFFFYFSIQVCGVYEDEVGLYDWKISTISKVLDAKIHNNKIFVITEAGVVASLNRENGDILWRQVLPNNEIPSTLIITDDGTNIFTLADSNKGYLWRADSGALLWDQVVIPADAPENHFADGIKQSLFIYKDSKPSQIAILSENSLFLLSVETGSIAANFTNQEAKIYGILTKFEKVYFLIFNEGDEHIHALLWEIRGDIQTFITVNTYLLERALHYPIQAVPYSDVFVTSFDAYICVFSLQRSRDPSCATFIEGYKGGKVDTYKLHTVTSGSKIDIAIEFEKEVYVYEYFGEKLRFVSKNSNEGKLVSVAPTHSTFILEKLTNGQPELFTFPANQQLPVTLFPSKNVNRGSVSRVFFDATSNPTAALLIWEDYTITYNSKQPSNNWIREESLAVIEKSYFIDIPADNSEAEPADSSKLFLFIYRISSQIQALKEFIFSASTPSSIAEKPDSIEKDRFAFNKLIISLTKSGKLICLSTASHEIVWSRFFKNQILSEIFPTNLHVASDSYFLLLAFDTVENEWQIYKIDPLSGAIIEREAVNYSVRDYFVFPPPSFLQINQHPFLVLLDQSLNVHVYPETEENKEAVRGNLGKLFNFQVNQEENSITGFNLLSKKEELWQINFPETEKIITVTENHEKTGKFKKKYLKKPGEDASIVMNKFSTKNVMAVATTEFVENQENIHVYLIDKVSGFLLFESFHPSTSSPFYSLLSDNWFVYSLWNKKTYKFELSIIELFFANASNPFPEQVSSFSSPNDLSFFSASFELPFHPTCLAVTQTRHSLTTKNILFGTTNGQLVSIDKRWVDPMRTLYKEKGEGLIPYFPELLLFDRSFISYNLQIEGINQIITTSSNLESTSLVFSWGLDLFFSHVRPADKFDMFQSDFDYVALIGTVVILFFATVTSYSVYRKKSLAKNWK